MSDVKLLALWEGWCDPCETERPLALTEHGARGLRAWLGGIGIEDRTLVLACEVCGQWQHVPQLEEDDPEPLSPAVPLILTTAVRSGVRSIVLAATTAEPVELPMPRRTELRSVSPQSTEAALLALLAGGLDVVAAGAA